jgi:Ion channel
MSTQKPGRGYVTATTVGYGDKYPITLGGRIVGTLVLTVGVALFATFSGFLANAFLSRKPEKPDAAADGSARAALQEVERLLAEQQHATETLRARAREELSSVVGKRIPIARAFRFEGTVHGLSSSTPRVLPYPSA